MDCLEADEQSLCDSINTDYRVQIDEEIQLITIRERRMMKRIQDLINGLSEKQRRVLQERQITKEAIDVNNDLTGETKTVVVPVPSLVVKSIEEVEYRKIEDILKLEDALTRVQEKKSKYLALKHSIEAADKNAEWQQSKIDNMKEMLAIRKRELELKEW
ncbi:MAG: hypothetical protein H6Q69_322 [Firmicutes bacterium]|nr:hypothetical protein [Bacillota bacterium]